MIVEYRSPPVVVTARQMTKAADCVIKDKRGAKREQSNLIGIGASD